MVLTRRLAGLLLVAGAFQWLVFPNFLRVVWRDDRAFGPDGGPTAFLLVHVAIVVPALLLGTALLVVGARAWRRAPRTRDGRRSVTEAAASGRVEQVSGSGRSTRA